MKPPIFVRTLSKTERKALHEGLRSKDAFVLRRSQILLASARGEIAPQIAENLVCASQTVRDAIHDFIRHGVDALVADSSRPKQTHAALDTEQTEALKELLHHSAREFARDSTSTWPRFVDGRLVSPITTRFLRWCCHRLQQRGKEALLLIWDNALAGIRAERSEAGSAPTTAVSKPTAMGSV